MFPVSQSAIDSIGDVTQFISTFELQYGNSHPEFFRGSYNDALSKARRDIKFMLVYLHSQDHMRTEQFCRNVVCSVGFTEYVNANMIFWACDVNTREGYRGWFLLMMMTNQSIELVVDRQQTHRQTHRQTKSQTNRDGQRNRQTDRQRVRQTDKQTDGQTYKQTDKESSRQAGRQTDCFI